MTSSQDLASGADAAAVLRFLVVDDDRANRRVLAAMLQQGGHAVIEAENGADAVALYASGNPDMVLMDIMMPVMDGYEATRLIKQQAGDHFVPVIFLTALQDELSLSRCIAAGGDDFLTKPFNRVILQSKIDALLRMRSLYQDLERQNREISFHHQRLQREQQVAEQLFRNIVHRGSLHEPNIRHLISPASLFNGDLLLAARHPSGSLCVMLGDFSGHGLPAAVGAIPVSEIFYVMTRRGYSIGEIVGEINRKLNRVLPTGYFLAACLLELDRDARRLTVWNGGIPDVLVAKDLSLRRLVSRHLPLGVLDNDALDRRSETIEVMPGERIFLYTDGAIEARSTTGEQFGQGRLEEILIAAGEAAFGTLCARLAAHRGAAEPSDDVTLIEITAQANLSTASVAAAVTDRRPTGWAFSLELAADTLRGVDPLPACVQAIMDLQGLYDHRERLYVILSELFNNAVDHGLLRLDSAIKDSPAGFAEFYAARDRALSALAEGHIRIELMHVPTGQGGRLSVRVLDSGTGSPETERHGNLEETRALYGRGLELVRSLCREVIVHGRGNHVEAVYEWPE